MIRSAQQELAFPRRGGRRPNAGRKPRIDRIGFASHVRRLAHNERHPVHVTMRGGLRIPNLRSERAFNAIRGCLSRARREGMRIVHFSVQSNHIHLIVEADDKRALARGIQGFASAVARLVNRVAGRRGSLWGDRYHRRDLTSPRQVRNALVYVLQNFRKHRVADVAERSGSLDPCSSALWFGGWEERAGPALAQLRRTQQLVQLESETHPMRAPVRAPRRWLLHTGWKKHGVIALRESPRSPF